eukprot:PhF_6_TR26258/c0_g1_i3/m.37558
MGNKQSRNGQGGDKYLLLADDGTPSPDALSPLGPHTPTMGRIHSSTGTVGVGTAPPTAPPYVYPSRPGSAAGPGSPMLVPTTGTAQPPRRPSTPGTNGARAATPNGRAGQPKIKTNPEEELWRTILNTTYEVGETCIREGTIPQEDITSCDPYVYTGLTALVVLHCVRHSLRNVEENALALPTGYILRPAAMSPETREVLSVLPQAKKLLREIESSSKNNVQEWSHLCVWVVTNDMPERKGVRMDSYDAPRILQHNQLTSMVYNIATPLTQTDQFRQNFQTVLTMLSERAASPPPMAKANAVVLPPRTPPPSSPPKETTPTTPPTPTTTATGSPSPPRPTLDPKLALPLALIERTGTIARNMIDCGIVRTDAALKKLRTTALALSICAVLDHATHEANLEDPSLISLREKLQKSFKYTTLDELFAKALHSANDEPCVNMARDFVLQLYPDIGYAIESTVKSALKGESKKK